MSKKEKRKKILNKIIDEYLEDLMKDVMEDSEETPTVRATKVSLLQTAQYHLKLLREREK